MSHKPDLNAFRSGSVNEFDYWKGALRELNHSPDFARGTGDLRGPGFLNADMSMFKDFHVWHEQRLGFRFDAFNVFNIVSYGNLDVGITDSNISNQGGPTRSTERHRQFSGNYRF